MGPQLASAPSAMRSLVLLSLLAAALLPRAQSQRINVGTRTLGGTQSRGGACPQFACGAARRGMFVDAAGRGEEARDSLRTYFLSESDFPEAYPEITGGRLSDGPSACSQLCSLRYNAQRVERLQAEAEFFMFVQHEDDGRGGTCSCFAKQVCRRLRWSPAWLLPEEAPGRGRRTLSTGRLCRSNGRGDPHFEGADGSNFDFSGEPNNVYALISDVHLQVNAFFGGRWDWWGGRRKSLTWMRQLSIMWGHHVALLSVRSGADASYGAGYMGAIEVDGEPLQIQPHSLAFAANEQFSVFWSGAKVRSGEDWVDVFEVSVRGALKLNLVLRPEVANLRTDTDAVVHFTVKVESAQLSSSVHGIVGQTFRPDFLNRLGNQRLIYSALLHKLVVPGDNAEGFLDGGVRDYRVRALDTAECSFCSFARALDVDEEMATALALSS